MIDPVARSGLTELWCNISGKSTKIGHFDHIFADLSPLFMIARVFAPVSHFTFPHTFSIQFLTGIIPTQAVYPEMSVRSLVFGKIMTTCCPNRLLFYNINIRYSIITQTSVIQFHFVLVIKTARQPFNHHTFCTPLTRHQHCSVNMVFTTLIIQFSTVIGFKILLYPQNLFKTDFNLIYIVIENHSILPYRSPIPLFHHFNFIVPPFQRSKGHQKRCFVLIVSLFQLIFFQFYQQHSPLHNLKTSTIT